MVSLCSLEEGKQLQERLKAELDSLVLSLDTKYVIRAQITLYLFVKFHFKFLLISLENHVPKVSVLTAISHTRSWPLVCYAVSL